MIAIGVLLKFFVPATISLIVLYGLGIRRRWQMNRANGAGPTSWSEAIAFHFILTLFKNLNKFGRLEKYRCAVYKLVLRRTTMKNHSWSCPLAGDKGRFVWRVEMPVLYGAIELPDEKRIELLVPLKGATDSDMRMFLFKSTGKSIAGPENNLP